MDKELANELIDAFKYFCDNTGGYCLSTMSAIELTKAYAIARKKE